MKIQLPHKFFTVFLLLCVDLLSVNGAVLPVPGATVNNNLNGLNEFIAGKLNSDNNKAFAAFAITSPASNTYFTIGNTFTFTIGDLPMLTSRVDYYADGALLGTSPNAPFSLPVNVTTGGSFSITARAYTANSGGVLLGTTAAIIINIYPPAPTSVSSASRCGSGAVTLTASGGTPSGGNYNWYTAATGGTPLQSSTSASFTPTVSVTTTYYVAYAVDGIESTSRISATATVSPAVSSPVSGATLSYPFSGNANDVSGFANNGTLQGAPTLTTDRFATASSAYSFNGTSQYVSTAKTFNNPVNFTLSLWFNTTTAGGKLIGFGNLQTGQSTQYDRHLYMNNTGQLYFGIYNGAATTINTAGSYNDGRWHRAVVTVSQTNGTRIYVDGALQVADAAMNTPENFTGYWRIGYDNLNGWPSQPGNFYFTGRLDDVAVYNRELTAAEVTSSGNLNLIGATTVFCAGNSVTLTAPAITGATYSWTDGTTTVTGNPATFTSASTGNYTLTVTAGSCSSTATVTPTSPTFTWTGASSTSTTLAANWNNTSAGIANQLPLLNGTETIVIPAGLSRYPLLAANASVYNLTIAAGASINLNSFILNVGCNIYNSNNTSNGILYNGNVNSQINWNGTVLNQAYVGTNTTFAAQLGRMVLTNTNASLGTVTISGGKVDIYNQLTLTTGKLVIASSGTVTLKSTSSLTASIPAITSPSVITGNIVAERFIQGGGTSAANTRRGYRLLSAPVSNRVVSGYNSYDLTNLQTNTIISGPTGNGFTVSPNNNPSVFVYKESDANPATRNINVSDYKGFANINDYIPMGNGILFFFRGNQNTAKSGNSGNAFTSPYPYPENTTLTFAGSVLTGPVNVNIPVFNAGAVSYYNAAAIATGASAGRTVGSFTTNLSYTSKGTANVDGFNLVGNPFPSTIDLEKVTFGSGISATIYTLNSATQAFNTYQRTGTNSDGIALNGASRYVLSGEGFFVKALSTGTRTVTFPEAAKTTYPTGAANTASGVPAVFSLKKNILASVKSIIPSLLGNNTPAIKIKLVQDSVFYNETLLTFSDQNNNEFNEEDVPYLTGPSQQIFMYSLSADGTSCTINNLKALEHVRSVKLFAEGGSTGLYQMQFSGVNSVDKHYRIFLKDSFTKDSLEITAHPVYNFNIDRAKAATYGANRFSLVVHKDFEGLYKLVDFNGEKAYPGNRLNWVTRNESSVVTFDMERSTDGGKAFINLGTVQSAGWGSYTFIDSNPGPRAVIYRLKQTDVNDEISYSDLIEIDNEDETVIIGGNNSGTKVYPNPAGAQISIDIAQPVKRSVKINIANSYGKYVYKLTFAAGQHFEQNVSALQPGVYIVDVFDAVTNNKIGSTKFIKM